MLTALTLRRSIIVYMTLSFGPNTCSGSEMEGTRPREAAELSRRPPAVVGDSRHGVAGDVVRQERALHIAYQVVGDGPLDLIYVPSAFGHLETFWEEPSCRAVPARAGVVRPPGHLRQARHGHVGPVRWRADAAERTDDVRAVMDAIGSERAALFGMSEGGAIAAQVRRHRIRRR